MTPRELLSQLREAAGKATPGLWDWIRTPFGWKSLTVIGRELPMIGGPVHVIYARNDGLMGIAEKDAAFIALANPANILRLVEYVGRLERVAEAGNDDENHWHVPGDEAAKKRCSLCLALAELREGETR